MNKTIFFTLLFFIGVYKVQAQKLRLPSFFSKNMVLQQQENVNFWGWARAGQEVKILASWSTDTIKTITSGDAEWKTSILTPKAGGPYKIWFQSQDHEITLENVMVGEVWLCSGQSNMQWSALNNVKEMKEALPSISNKNIRFLQISNIAAQTPQNDIYDKWTECDPKSAEAFSAIGYFFAENLNKNLDIPIGIINASWGGSAAEYWVPKEDILNDPELFKNSKLQKIAPRKPYQPGVLWNSMIHPFAGYNIAGALWYQGEDNTISYWGYDHLMQTLISSWRKAWNKEFPFYFVQIAPHSYKYEKPNAALLREQQAKTAMSISKTGMVVTTDLVDNIKDIHPQKKRAVALRLADLAFVNDYGIRKKDYQSPIYKDYIVEDDKIRIRFYYAEGKLQVKDKEIIDLYIAGNDHVFKPANFKIENNELLVFSKEVPLPIAVRFGFSNTSMPNLFSSTGLPVSPFRTDNWDF